MPNLSKVFTDSILGVAINIPNNGNIASLECRHNHDVIHTTPSFVYRVDGDSHSNTIVCNISGTGYHGNVVKIDFNTGNFGNLSKIGLFPMLDCVNCLVYVRILLLFLLGIISIYSLSLCHSRYVFIYVHLICLS